METPTQQAVQQAGRSLPRRRSRYLDVLRATAIVRVFVHHSLWIGWLTFLFPSMWVMFALAGCLTAASLERGGPVRTLRSRLRRLLPPLWVFAAVAVPLMIARGWLADQESPLRWSDLLYWVLPLANPPASAWGGPFVLALWYLRAYLWFVLLSPALWWAYRRWPLATLVAPILTALILDSPLVNLPTDKITDVVWATALYGTCWILGFARHTGRLDRIPLAVCAVAAVLVCGAGILWGVLRLNGGWPLQNVAADALWGTGYALILMRLRPSMAWLDRVPLLERIVAFVNARAMTIYIWHLPALFAAGTILLLAGVDLATPRGLAATFGLGLAATAVTTAVIGWVEDLAARRRPRLLPGQPATPASSPA
ncbi:acyltransferase family protein [Rhizomonospora bruguierae]|uniref:acyltransferase family protein n=1 Tax=Rhizomonospora bruguierae TaxID=1581705 RepID=UPI001BCB415B|nr:acyltransferase [Micromonospora sp. NBRC 107566]